jgi:hypothetical protein
MAHEEGIALSNKPNVIFNEWRCGRATEENTHIKRLGDGTGTRELNVGGTLYSKDETRPRVNVQGPFLPTDPSIRVFELWGAPRVRAKGLECNKGKHYQQSRRILECGDICVEFQTDHALRNKTL